jgi:hypothetical protein
MACHEAAIFRGLRVRAPAIRTNVQRNDHVICFIVFLITMYSSTNEYIRLLPTQIVQRRVISRVKSLLQRVRHGR